MIEDAQKTDNMHAEQSATAPRHALAGRRLSAIEIAEGALLADIGVIFQLLIRFLPVGGSVIQVLVPVVFALLVLRRGLYVACMSLCVSLFIICVVLGPGGMPLLLLEVGAGLFLGTLMRQRWHHLAIILLGIPCGSAALCMYLLLYSFLAGGPAVLIRGMRESYAVMTPVVAGLLKQVGLGNWWLQWGLPHLNVFAQWAFQHWLLLFYLVYCTICVVVVPILYAFTNFCLRRLGYYVRPFPGYRLTGAAYALVRGLLKLVPERTFARSVFLYRLRIRLRVLNIARMHQLRLEKEAKDSV